MRSIYDPRYIETIGNLRTVRENQGLTQAELSGRLGKPQSYIAKIETRERRIDLIETLDLCSALGISVDFIIPSEMKHLICTKDDQEDGQ